MFQKKLDPKVVQPRTKVRETEVYRFPKVLMWNLLLTSAIMMVVDHLVRKERRKMSTTPHHQRGQRRANQKTFMKLLITVMAVESSLRNWNTKCCSRSISIKWMH